MYIIQRVAKKKTKVVNNQDFMADFKYISKGTKYIQFHNGTLGAGARYKNYTVTDFKELIKEVIK